MTKGHNIYSICMAWGVKVKDYDTHIEPKSNKL